MSFRAATLLGTGAILLWATLASLTALKGPVPPFQTTAIVFVIGGALMVAVAALRAKRPCSGRRARRWRSASTGCSSTTRSISPP